MVFMNLLRAASLVLERYMIIKMSYLGQIVIHYFNGLVVLSFEDKLVKLLGLVAQFHFTVKQMAHIPMAKTYLVACPSLSLPRSCL